MNDKFHSNQNITQTTRGSHLALFYFVDNLLFHSELVAEGYHY